MSDVSAECYGCEKPFQDGDRILVSTKYPDSVAFHVACREPGREYAEMSWPVKDMFTD